MARGGWGLQAEDYIVERIGLLLGWQAVNVNLTRSNTPGHDVRASNAAGHELLVSVKSRSRGRDYAVGSSFKKYPVDIYAFVDMTDGVPGAVYLAGGKTVVELAEARHSQYQADRGRSDDVLGSWSPKVSESILEAMATRDAWDLLDHQAPAAWPPVTEQLLSQARGDAPKPRGT